MKKRFIHHCILSVLLLFVCNYYTSAQQSTLDTLRKKFDVYRKNNFQEKIYVHVNQSTFLTGEIAWFSIYSVDASFHKPSSLSSVAYVELVDANNQVALQGKIELKEGVGSGSFYLSPAINSGNYHLRAYTHWMKNYSAEFYFHKPITIINTFTPLENNKPSLKAPTYDAQFFPEGGNLVAGVESTVGFRVVDKSGKGISFHGALLSAQNDTILHFTPSRVGIGQFRFTPSNETYKAVIKDRDGKWSSFALPAVSSSGYVLSAADSSDRVILKITKRNVTAASTFVFIHARNRISHAEVVQENTTTIVVNKKDLADGISHVTLFDSFLQPIAERLVFKRPTQVLALAAKPNQNEYGIRRPVKIDVTATTSANAGRSTNFSISVYKKDSIASGTSDTILDYLWLRSDLQGTVESPSYYFNENEPGVNQAIDNVMLTHGWRRFDWKEILTQKPVAKNFTPEYQGHTVNGEVRDLNNNLAPGILTYFSSPSRAPRVSASRSDALGRVHFAIQDFYGPKKVVLQTNYKIDSVYKVTVQNPFSTLYAALEPLPLRISSNVKNDLLARSVAMQVSDVYHRDKQEKLIRPLLDTTAFYGKADEHYRLDDFTRFPVMEEVMREYVPGVMVRKRKDGFHFMLLDDVNASVFSETPLMLIDGVPFFDEDEIMAFNPLKIKTLDVMRRRYYLGILAIPGVVSYGTYAGDLGGFSINPHSVVLDYEGLQLQREFYVPQYDTQKQRDARLPDQRYMLYWNGRGVTDADGKQQLNFFTSDVPGEYHVIIEGISSDGAAGSSSTTFSVKSFNN